MNVTIDQLREIMIQAEITMKNPAELDPEVPLRQQGIDSLDMATFVFFLEEALSITIPHTEYKRLGTLKSLADALNENGEAWAKKK